MKIIHCADIHADSKMETCFSKEQADQRRKEIAGTFANMVGFARENGVKVILIAGDFFDTKTSQQKNIKKRFSYIISQNPDIDFLYLRGNHDEDVEFATDENLPNLKRFSKDKWTCYSYGNVNIYGREFQKTIPLRTYSELAPDADKINIVALHGQTAGYKSNEGAPVISLPHLANKNIDYVALGHIHDHQISKLDSRGVWCYSGCLEGRGFDECGEKGFVLLDISDKIVTTFVDLAQRTVHKVNVPVPDSDYNTIMKAVSQAVSSIPAKDIVQVDLTGEISEDTEIETDSYEAALESDFNFYYLRVKNKTETKIDYEKYKDDVSLKGEFIRLVKENGTLSDAEKSRIIMTGIRALAGRLK